MSKLSKERQDLLKEQAKTLRAEIRKNNSSDKKWARELRDELSPELFISVKEMSEALIRVGGISVSKDAFTITSGPYFDRVAECIKKTPYIRTIMEGKVHFIREGSKLQLKAIQASNSYILDEVVTYLSKHDIGLMHTGYSATQQFKFYIID